MGARNRDAAVAASSFIVTHIVVATAKLLIVRAATKRRYRRCCPLLWRCGLLPPRRCAAAVVTMRYRRCCPLLWRCGLLPSRRCAVVTMRSVFPGTAALARACVAKPTENPLTSLITAALSPSRQARLTIFKFYGVKSSLYGVGCQIRRQAGHGAAPSRANFLEAAKLIPRLAAANAQPFAQANFGRTNCHFTTDTHAYGHTDKLGYRK